MNGNVVAIKSNNSTRTVNNSSTFYFMLKLQGQCSLKEALKVAVRIVCDIVAWCTKLGALNSIEAPLTGRILIASLKRE
jgi:hypothetical protein